MEKLKNTKRCSDCARWTKPLKHSACRLGSSTPLRFKENDKGIYYCDDFKLKAKGE